MVHYINQFENSEGSHIQSSLFRESEVIFQLLRTGLRDERWKVFFQNPVYPV